MTKRILFVLVLFTLSYFCNSQTILWQFKTNNRIYSSPIIEEDTIYFGSGDQSFYALNKVTGNTLWKFKTEGAVHSSPTISNNTVFFASQDGNLYAVNKTNGKLVWKFASNGEKMYDLWDYYLSSPKVENETVYWGCGDGNVYAINNVDGSLKWKFKTEDVVHASPVIYNETLLIGSFDGYFYSINKGSGELVWKFKTVGAQYFPKGDIQRAALVKNDVAFFGSRDYNIYAIDAKTGKGYWNMRQLSGWIIATPVNYKDYIYFGTSDAHLFYCMNKNTGEIIWTKNVNMRVYGSAIIHDEVVYFGTFDGKVLGVDYKTGETKWEFQTKNSKLNYSTIYNEKGEFKDGFELYGSGFENSEKMIHDLGSILSSPVIDNEIIYFGSSDGNMYAIKLK